MFFKKKKPKLTDDEKLQISIVQKLSSGQYKRGNESKFKIDTEKYDDPIDIWDNAK